MSLSRGHSGTTPSPKARGLPRALAIEHLLEPPSHSGLDGLTARSRRVGGYFSTERDPPAEHGLPTFRGAPPVCLDSPLVPEPARSLVYRAPQPRGFTLCSIVAARNSEEVFFPGAGAYLRIAATLGEPSRSCRDCRRLPLPG